MPVSDTVVHRDAPFAIRWVEDFDPGDIFEYGAYPMAEDDIIAFAQGHVIFTDLGHASGIAPGDVLTLFRDRDADPPRTLLGQAIVLTVGPTTSMAKVTASVRDSYVGDSVELR